MMSSVPASVQKASSHLIKGLSCLAQLALIFMVVSICYDIVMRYLFARPTLWCLEVNTFLIVFLALVPAGDVLHVDKHFKITFLPDRLRGLGKKIQAVSNNLLGLIFCSLMVWKGYEMTYFAFVYDERMSTPLGTPLFLPYLLIPLGFGALAVQFLANTLRTPEKRAEEPSVHLEHDMETSQ